MTNSRIKKGFTLIELLVVIAIIGVLASVVLASLNTARRKSRDARRISDVKQIQLALEMYFDSNSGYPTALSALASTYIPVVPTDPIAARTCLAFTAPNYCYSALGSGASCTSYHLGANLEDSNHSSLNGDRDAVAGTACTGSAADFTSVNTDSIYDVTP